MRFSKSILAASAGLVLIPVLSASFGAPPSKPEGPSETELLDRIERLEARVSELEKKSPKSMPTLEQTETTESFGTARMPPRTVERQFNGGTYYVVPISQPQANK